MSTASTDDATSVAWDLEPLVHGEGAAGVTRLLDEAQARSDAFAASHQGEVAALDAAGLAAAVTELGEISELVGRAGNYASLKFAEDTAEPENGRMLAELSERAARLETTLLFFDLEWNALDEATAERLVTESGVQAGAHHLRTLRRYRPHQLTEPEEKILAETSVTGAGAWDRLFDELTSAIEVELPPEGDAAEARTVSLDVALSGLQAPDRETRRTTAEAVTAGLRPGLRTRAFVFNTLLQDKAIGDRLRAYPSWLASRNLANEASDDSVAALVDAVQANYDLPQRWYRLKAGLLGIDRLADYDRMAPLETKDEAVSWGEARDLVLESFAGFSPELADAGRRFFDEPWIDAPPRPGKRGGAFCAYTVPGHHPYLLLNWTGRRRDALTLAHELGHGLHAYLARDRGPFEQHTPLTFAETASVFGETLVLERLLGEASDAEARLGLLSGRIDDAVATIFRQTAMNRFEDAVHTARREEGELSTDRFGELWTSTQSDMLGDAVELSPGYATWWSYIPHFIGTPGYVYAYAYGQLMALSVYARYVEEGTSFAPRYLELLAAGGSRSPGELAAMAGLDLDDPGFWQRGLDLVRAQLDDAEAAAREAGRLPG